MNGTIHITWKNENILESQKWKKNSIEMNKRVKELSEMGTEFALGLGMSSLWDLYKEISWKCGDKPRLGNLILNRQLVCNISISPTLLWNVWSLINQHFNEYTLHTLKNQLWGTNKKTLWMWSNGKICNTHNY